MEALSRITPATVDVLGALLDSGPALWGLRIVKATGRPSGSVYPILERLERAGWVRSSWEEDAERSGPRRRLYSLTEDGAVAARAVLERATERSAARRVAQVNPVGQEGNADRGGRSPGSRLSAPQPRAPREARA